VPQGLSVSNALSEIYLEGLDLKLKRIHPRIIYYSRYVDDILIMISGEITQPEKIRIETEIRRLINFFGLKLNEEKVDYVAMKWKDQVFSSFEYLGYKFSIGKKALSVSLSESKEIKFKRKIDFCFRQFNIDGNFNLLYERLSFLTRKNIVIKKEKFLSSNKTCAYKLKKIHFGIIESYKYIDVEKWKDLDRYLRIKINSVKAKIPSRKEKRILYSLSLERSFLLNIKNKIFLYTKEDYIKKIRAINPNVSRFNLLHKDILELSKIYFDELGFKNIQTL
jgi:Reverse transcriptase (RNA-dependent DNA polymerase)